MVNERTNMLWSTRASFVAFPFVTAFAQVGLLPVLPQIKAHFSDIPNVDVIVRFLVSGVGLAMIFGAPFAGMLARRFGWRRSLVVAILVFCVAGASGAFLGNIWAILASRLLVGLAAAILGALLMAILTLRLDGEKRDRWIGFVVVSGSLGSMILILLSGFIGSIDWRLPFLFHLAGAAVLFFILPGIEEPAAAPVQADGQAAQPASRFPFWALCIGLLIGALVQAHSTFIPFHLANIGAGNPQLIGIAMVAGVPILCTISYFYGTFRRYLSIKALFIIASIACTAGFLLIGLAQSLFAVVIGQIVAGIGAGLLSPNMFAFAALRSAPSERARDIGFVRGSFSAGPIVGQIALEPVAAVEGPGIAVASLSVLALGALAWFVTVTKGSLRPARS